MFQSSAVLKLDIEEPPSFERAAKGDLVGVLKVAAHRQAAGQAGHSDAHRLDKAGEVGRRGLALQIRIGGEDQFGDRAIGEPGHELLDPQVFGPDALDGADRAAQYVVAAAELAGLLDRHNVLGLFDHADDVRVTPGVAADPALFGLGHVAADPAELHLVLHFFERVGQPAHVGRVGGQQVEGDTLRALGADAGQPAQLVDEVLHDPLVHAPAPFRFVGAVGAVGVSYEPGWPGSPGRFGRSPRPGSPPPSPSVSGPIFSRWRSPAARPASRIAASTRSAMVSADSAGSVTSMALGSMTMPVISPWPLAVAVTRPPPAVPVTVVSASSCCALSSCSCTRWACSSICWKFSGPPGSTELSFSSVFTRLRP